MTTHGVVTFRRWTDQLLPLVGDDADPLGVTDLTTDRVPLEQAPDAFAAFQKKAGGTIKLVPPRQES